MKTAIILHGMPSRLNFFVRPFQSKCHWLPWLKEQLIAAGIAAETPDMPEPYAPDYEKWRAVFEQFPINEQTMLIGHSCGGGFLLRWLSENKIKVGKVALVAPWTDPNRNRAPKMFNNFEIDPSLIECTAGMAMFCSSDDSQEEQDTFALVKSKFPTIEVKQFSDRGHFTGQKNKEFPELRDFLLK